MARKPFTVNTVDAYTNGIKSSVTTKHTCDGCGCEFELSSSELLYTYPPYFNRKISEGSGRIRNWKSRVALEFCSYTCRAKFIKEHPEEIEKIDKLVFNNIT